MGMLRLSGADRPRYAFAACLPACLFAACGGRKYGKAAALCSRFAASIRAAGAAMFSGFQPCEHTPRFFKCAMRNDHCPLPTAHCPLPTAHCPLPADSQNGIKCAMGCIDRHNLIDCRSVCRVYRLAVCVCAPRQQISPCRSLICAACCFFASAMGAIILRELS